MPDNLGEASVGPSLLDRIRQLEQRLEHLEAAGDTGLSGTDQTIRGSHDRLDTILGAGGSGPIHHHALTGLEDDDHGQYYNSARHTVGIHDNLNINADRLDALHMPQTWYRKNNPDAVDDEFNGTLSAWTVATSGVPTYDCNTTWPSAVRAKLEAATGYFQLYRSYSWGPNVADNLAAMFYAPINWDNQIVRLQVWDSDWTDGMMLQVGRWGSANRVRLTSVDAGVWTDRLELNPVQMQSSAIVCVLETDNANNWKGGFGWGGYPCVLLGGYNKSLTGTSVYLEIAHSAGPSQRITYGIEWFRRNFMYLWG